MVPPPAVVRIMDANANRALEGIRVCEEIARFHLEDRGAFAQLRSLRHAIAGAVSRLSLAPRELVAARASRRDVGRRASASRVASLERLLIINFQRAKESLRTLEECSRVVAPRQTASFARVRFRIYEVERRVICRVASLRHS